MGLCRRRRRLALATALAVSFLVSRSAAAAEDPARAAVAAALALPPGGVHELKAIEIGGIKQWISVRGAKRDNPILLFVHGGPGAPMMAESWTYQRPWEDFFTVVQWDQRGSGKTFSESGRRTDQPLSLDLIANDTVELIEYLRKTYHQRKIFLMGHSWGSVVGLTVAQRRPDLLHAYIGVGQVVDMRRNEAEGYRLNLEEARRLNDVDAIKALEALAPYPEKDGSIAIAKTATERRWNAKLRGMVYADFVDNEDQRRRMSPDYSDYDVESARLGETASPVALWPELQNVSFDAVKSLAVPIIIFGGAHDHTTPTEISRRFFDRLTAPYKRFFLIDDAAHYVVNEAPGEVLVDLVDTALPLAKRR